MLQTYEGTLNGNCIDWIDEPPRSLVPLRVFITILSEAEDRSHGSSQKAVAILRNLSQTNPFASIADPLQWQQEIRQDRVLPGRD